jgi:2-iminobutanoate/2-iminopropanoate deaminase
MTQAARGLVQLFGQPAGRLMPAGIRLGQTIYAPNLTGTNAQSGELVDGLEAQMEQALQRMRDVLVEAGAATDNVARATAYVGSTPERDPIYGPWDRLFPDAADRPAFKVLVAPLPAGVRVRLDVFALAGGRRRRIDVEGVPARDPTVKIGNWLATSRVHGTDPRTGKVAQGQDAEIQQAFQNVASLLELAGARRADLSQLLLFVADPARAQPVAERARQFFSDLSPSQLTGLTNFIPPHLGLMVEAIAVEGELPLREVFSRADLTPIPDAAYIGNLLVAPALVGEGSDFQSQLRNAFGHMQACLAQAGLTLSEVAQVGVYMRDLDWKPLLNDVWSELFPDPNDRPPHKYVPLEGGDPGKLVEVQMFAVRGAHRQVLEIPGMVHGDPMSMGARTGDLLFSSRVVGTDTSTGKTPPDPDLQARLALDNVRTLLQQAGASTANVTQVNAFINDEVCQAATLKAWRGVFPEGSAQPRLHFLNAHLPGSTVVRLEVLAAC